MKPRSAGHLYVSALHYFVMLSILPTPPLHLSVTARGFVRVAIAQPRSALWSSAAQAFVGAHRASLTLASSRFEVCASLLALGRGCVSRFLPVARLGQWVRCAPVSVGGQQSRFGGRSIKPSFPCGSNPPLNPVRFALWTLRDKAAQRRLALRYASRSGPPLVRSSFVSGVVCSVRPKCFSNNSYLSDSIQYLSWRLVSAYSVLSLYRANSFFVTSIFIPFKS